MLRASTTLLLALGLTGCIMPPTSSQRLTESAYDLNEALRFNRMDIAIDHVRETAREKFSAAHAGWGRAVRIVDYDFSGVSIRKDGDADVVVSVQWQRPDESTMRSTEIAQRWSEKRGTWWMISEEERSGDRGLLADAKPADGKGDKGDKGDGAKGDAAKPDGAAPPPAAPAQRSRYQTRVIYEQ